MDRHPSARPRAPGAWKSGTVALAIQEVVVRSINWDATRVMISAEGESTTATSAFQLLSASCLGIEDFATLRLWAASPSAYSFGLDPAMELARDFQECAAELAATCGDASTPYVVHTSVHRHSELLRCLQELQRCGVGSRSG